MYAGFSIIAGYNLPVSVCKVHLESQEITKLKGRGPDYLTWKKAQVRMRIDPRGKSGGEMNTLLVL